VISPPDTIPKEAHELWATVTEHFEERGAWLEIYIESLVRYCNAVDLSRRAWKKVPKSMVARGSMGQAVVHPMIKVAQTADAEAAKFAKELGIDAAVKRGVGRPKGSTSAPDRADVPEKITRRLRSIAGGSAS
jgi:P27 family predicted phage terminase small subunit